MTGAGVESGAGARWPSEEEPEGLRADRAATHSSPLLVLGVAAASLALGGLTFVA